MSSTKALLKSAAEAVKSNRLDDAITQATNIITTVDPSSYQARILLAFALDKKSRTSEAESTYDDAARLKPNDAQAWQGLIKIYEGQASSKDIAKKLPAYQNAAFHLAQVYAAGGEGDMYKTQDVIDKFIDFARAHGDRRQYVDALGLILPESPIYGLLEGRVPSPAKTYETIATILEAEDKKLVNTLIGERRTRLGAKVGEVTSEVTREVLGRSRLGDVYRELIGWTNDDDLRRQTEEKLLKFHYDRLLAFTLGSQEKAAELEVVRKLADGMVIIKYPYRLAWEIAIDWKDAKETKGWDVAVLRDYCTFFPSTDLSKIITGYLTSSISPFPKEDAKDPQTKPGTSAAAENSESEDDEGGGAPTLVVPVSDEDRLLMMTEGIATAKSLFAYRLTAEYYQHIQEWETNAETIRKGLQIVQAEHSKTGISFQNTKDALNVYLGTSLVYYQSPRHHQEAKSLFDDILSRDPTSTAALIGVGMVYEEEEDYTKAIDFLDRAYTRDPSNLRVRTEAAWVKCLAGDTTTAQSELEACISEIAKPSSPYYNLLAQARYRLGICIWTAQASPKSRKSRSQGSAYSYFLAALQADLNYAPAYTSLGIFYADYARDKSRARKCFQKAVELSSSELISAERLASSFADDGDWDKVELVAQRVVDSGKVRPPPGSKRKGVAWPFKALGVAELHKQEYGKAIVSFQSALRMTPEDYGCWVGLGESYYSSGRFVAATKAVQNAMRLEEERQKTGEVEGKNEEAWFTAFVLANIKRELGEYDEAIVIYQQVLKERPGEEGVALALMQALVDSAADDLEKGLYGKAVDLAKETLTFALEAPEQVKATFNLWKAVADACAIFSSIQSRLSQLPIDTLEKLLEVQGDASQYSVLQDVDQVDVTTVSTASAQTNGTAPARSSPNLTKALHATILAHKRAIHLSAHDIHAQSVAYYNLGWAEHRAHISLHSSSSSTKSASSRYLRASIRCFKRAIELEASNAGFWDALGVVTSQINPSIAQHAFVRSLHLDERSVQAWTNLATLALMQNDVQLANEAFTRAQSTDPEYAHAWLGQGLIALLVGDVKEARGLFTHALEISSASDGVVRQQYSMATFDYVLTASGNLNGVTALLQPILALGQLRGLRPEVLAYGHLASLFQERVSDSDKPVQTLGTLCEKLEAEYEETETATSLRQFALAKTDLARALLATQEYAEAVECGEMALQLSSDESASELDAEERRKARLSAHLTCGLAQYYVSTTSSRGEMSAALGYFEQALAESTSDPDAVCLLAQVLWATGSTDAKDRAREILFEVVEKVPEHVQAVLLLGVIALLDGDDESLEAVVSELQGLRVTDSVTVTEKAQIADVLQAIVGLSPSAAAQDGGELAQAQTDVMLSPWLPHGWSDLAQASIDDSGDQGSNDTAYPREMALKVALEGIPPKGHLAAQDLSAVYAGNGTPATAQIGVFVAPWASSGWEALADALGQA